MAGQRTVAIVGVGNVGIAVAYAIFHRRAATDILLVDVNEKRARGEALDLMQGQALVGRTSVRAVPMSEFGGADVVILSAGVPQRPGESRLDLLGRNIEVLAGTAAELDRYAPNAIVLVASNPVDILTQALHARSKRPAAHVIGTGTYLDSSRLRALVGEHYGLDPRSVHASILGEHGDSEVPLWSSATVGGAPLGSCEILGKKWDKSLATSLFARARDAATEVIGLKGYTNLAIGSVIASMVEQIFGDHRRVVPLSVPHDGSIGSIGTGICFSVPCVLGRDGVLGRVMPPLDAEERALLVASAGALRDRAKGVGL